MAIPQGQRKRLKSIVLTFILIAFVYAAVNAERYDWEDYDYYQILGIAPSSNLDKATIKKAYRKEAKAWHPDKVVHNESVTTEESNKRFQRIAEAYQVLSDDEQRTNYDSYLQRSQQQKQQRSTREKHHSDSRSSETTFGFDDFQMNWQNFDPRKIFEDIFDPSQFLQDLYEQGTAAFESTFGGHEQDYDHPFRDSRSKFGREDDLGKLVFAEEKEKTLYDSFSGQEILRVIRVEEYLQRHRNVYYRRVLVRDFVEEWDPRSRTFVLVPLHMEPVVMQEDYRPAHDQQRPERHQSRQNNQRSSARESRNSKYGLWTSAVGSVLMPGHTLNMQQVLLLEDYKLAAGVTSDCELEIVTVGEDEWGEEIFEKLWSSESKSSFMARKPSCSLRLQSNGQLLLLAQHGATSQPLVLWSSPEDGDPYDDIRDFNFHRRTPEKDYTARLDTDGALSVYRLETVPRWLLLCLLLDGGFFAEHPRLGAIEPHWNKLMSVLFNLQRHSVYNFVRLRCIYSTGPAGCFRPARFMVRHTRPAVHFWQKNGHIVTENAREVLHSITKALRHPSVRRNMAHLKRFLQLNLKRLDSFLDDLIG